MYVIESKVYKPFPPKPEKISPEIFFCRVLKCSLYFPASSDGQVSSYIICKSSFANGYRLTSPFLQSFSIPVSLSTIQIRAYFQQTQIAYHANVITDIYHKHIELGIYRRL